MDSSTYLDGKYGIIALWHQHRYLFIILTVVLLFALKFYSLKRAHAPKELAISSPEAEIKNVQQTLPEKAKTRPRAPKRVTGKTPAKSRAEILLIQPHIFYFSLTGTTTAHASKLKARLSQTSGLLPPELHDLATIEHEDYFEHGPEQEQRHDERSPQASGGQFDFDAKRPQSLAENGIKMKATAPVAHFYLLLIPSYNIDTALDNFVNLLKETHHDFRIDSAPLRDLAGYSVFGLGDKEGWPTEQKGFCSQAIATDRWMARLTAGKRIFPLGLGDVRSDLGLRLDEWTDGVEKTMMGYHGELGDGAPGSGDACESDEDTVKPKTASMGDLEDLGPAKAVQELDFTTDSPKPMVPKSSPTYAALTKQGYTIVGSHSGVKICRWTKSALRGRGSCYKYSFYGIASHLCMETTPALSCSNKCVFCWRHGTNPVGTTWRWEVNPPDMIFQGAKEGHYKKIKMMRGVPGVRAERFQEAMRIRHCALSLVGEPIFYPHINEFVALLHREHISSFLVCNAQHPEQLETLQPVTQLYVSIDASNAESLRKIDRPLHRDYWQRFLRCLDIIKAKRFSMRTVYRLTLVKGFNIESEAEGYADLVARGLPCFVEIKGVTYCGTSTSASAGLTMQNVPFYSEVQAFVEALNAALGARGLEYGIAAEHAHSCCALIASRRFFVEEKWHSLINYDKFFTCLESGQKFRPEDYMGSPTPDWALWGNGGFDPRDQRVDRKGRPLE